MARCDYCHSSILFGGTHVGSYRFCNQNCATKGQYLLYADQLPANLVAEQVQRVHQGDCPKCGGPGPVDVHTSHTIWSMVVLTSWRSTPRLSCQSCGTKSKLLGTASSLVLGWWGFPWELIITPIQLIRNVGGMISTPDPHTPSPELEKTIKLNIAANMLANQEQQ